MPTDESVGMSGSSPFSNSSPFARSPGASDLRIVTASANPDKVQEIASLFAAEIPDHVLLPRPADVPDVVEDADTLLGNARLKARALVSATGLPAVADDTGLFVDALNGRPGVHTARYAGDHATYDDNCTKLLLELSVAGALTPGNRTARFKTVAIVAFPDGRELHVEGVAEGLIAPERRGEGGFGYDPLFVPDDGNGLTFAELGPEVKNVLSHRGRAFRGLAALLRGTVTEKGGSL
jgi:XTP/dITP diphosphohydrolase